MPTVKTLIGNIKGPKGDTGAKGDKGETGAQGPTGPQGNTGATGATGATGQRGSRWTQGTAITGTSTTATVFSNSGITDALVNDNYLNTSTGNTYRCTVAGNASTAKWVYSGNIKGAKGDKGDTGPQGPAGATGAQGPTGATGPQGPKGDKGATGATGPSGTADTTFTMASSLAALTSGEAFKTMLGKIAKAVSTLISHVSTKATSSVLGHIKVTDSSAVTDSTGLALAATEKNASISGTLANQISQLNTDLDIVDITSDFTIENTEYFTVNQFQFVKTGKGIGHFWMDAVLKKDISSNKRYYITITQSKYSTIMATGISDTSVGSSQGCATYPMICKIQKDNILLYSLTDNSAGNSLYLEMPFEYKLKS